VTDEMLVRLLDTFEWKQQLQSEHPLTYVQGELTSWCKIKLIQSGMNALAAPFLYTMPTQVEAFACFSLLIERWVPEYVQTDLRGVHRGVEVSTP
jgi:cell cycle arrest protein BUB2